MGTRRERARALILTVLLLLSPMWADPLKEADRALQETRYEDALTLLSASTSQEPKTVAQIALKKAEILTRLGRHQHAYFARGEAYDAARRSGLTPLAAAAARGLAASFIRQRQDRTAARYLKEAKALYKAAGDSEGLANIELLRGNLQAAQGRYEVAARSYQKALKGTTRPSQKAAALSNLANLKMKKSQYDEAQTLYQQALESVSSSGQQGAALLLNAAAAQLEQGAYDRALEWTRLAQKKFAELGLASGQARALLQIGLIHFRVGAYKQAISYSREAGVMARKAKLDMPLDWQLALRLYRAAAMRLSDQKEQARKLLERTSQDFDLKGPRGAEILIQLAALQEDKAALASLQRASSMLGDDPLSRAWLELSFADLLRRGDAPGEALPRYQKALVLAQDLRRPLPDIEWRALFGLGRLARLRGEKKPALEFYGQALDKLERLHGTLDNEELKTGFSEDKQPFYLEMIDLLLEQREPEQAFIISERARARSLTDILRRGDVPVGAPRPVPSLASLRSKLPPRSLLLSYLCGDEQTVVFALSKTQFRAAKLAVSRAQLEALVGQTRPGQNNEFSSSSSSELYRLLVQPFATELGEQHLIVLPSGPLHYLSFASLLTPEQNYLIEQRPISLGFSCTTLSGPSKNSEGQKVLVYAAPESKGKVVAGTTRSLPLRVRHSDFAPLPGAEKEARGVAALYAATQLRLGDQCRASLWSQDRKQPYSTVHFATHGFADDRNPMLSGLLLTPESDHDGFLLARDIHNQSLNFDLAILSACETALGKVSGGEGMVGLVHAFRAAGVPQVVASLWPVSDQHTGVLMERFHQNLAAGNPATVALQKAQIQSITEQADPHLWSPFVAIGLERSP